MEIVKHTVILDFIDNGCFDTGWRIKQGDYEDVQIILKVLNDGKNAFDDSITPQIAFKRPDGKTVLSTMDILSDSYGYNFKGNELAIAGPVVMDVKFVDSQGRISTASCKFTCVEDTIGYDPTGASTYSNPVSELIAVAEVKAVDSEAWAVGQRNGVDVGPEDETYHNNAKYWAEQSGGGGVSSYNALIDKPQINGTELLGNKSAADLGLQKKLTAGSNITIDEATGTISASGGGQGGTTNYNDLSNKPSINGVVLSADKSTSDLGINIPTQLSQLSEDETHRLVTDTEKTTWNNKSNFDGNYNSLSNKPSIPSALSQLTEDATHRTVTDEEKAKWNQGGGGSSSASDITYDNSTSGMTATNVQDAIDEQKQDLTQKTKVERITLVSGLILERFGNYRVLHCINCTYSTFSSLFLDAKDRPKQNINGYCLRSVSGAYMTQGLVEISSIGAIACRFNGAYNASNSTLSVMGASDRAYFNISWVVD